MDRRIIATKHTFTPLSYIPKESSWVMLIRTHRSFSLLSHSLFTAHNSFSPCMGVGLPTLSCPLFGFEMPPPAEQRLTYADLVAMLGAASEATLPEKWKAAADYIFLLTLE